MMKFKIIAAIITMVAAAAIVTSCSDSNESVSGNIIDKGTHDNENSPMTITVHVFENNNEFDKYLRTTLGERAKRDGLAEWFVRHDTGEVVACDIYVKKIRSVKDKDRMYEWGHELAHCIYGSYHKE